MKRSLPKYVYWRGSKNRYPYFERGGLSHRMPAPDTPEFHREYAKLLDGRGVDKPSPRTLSALIKRYRQSPQFLDKKPRTRADYEKVLDYLDRHVGKVPVTKFRTMDIVRAQTETPRGVRFGNYIVTLFSLLFTHAKRIGWRDDNPAQGIEMLKTPKDREKPHAPWPDWAVEKARAEMHPMALLVVELGINSVQRPDDLTKFTWGDYDGENLRLAQGKTGVFLVLPCTERLKAALERAREGFTPLPTRPILTSVRGLPMTYRRMSEIVLAERKRLGLEAFDLHGLRYRGIQELAWAGCTDDEIAAYSGHMSKSMVAKYAGPARQIMRARQANAKRK